MLIAYLTNIQSLLFQIVTQPSYDPVITMLFIPFTTVFIPFKCRSLSLKIYLHHVSIHLDIISSYDTLLGFKNIISENHNSKLLRNIQLFVY